MAGVVADARVLQMEEEGGLIALACSLPLAWGQAATQGGCRDHRRRAAYRLLRLAVRHV
jgi:hypothetical protein